MTSRKRAARFRLLDAQRMALLPDAVRILRAAARDELAALQAQGASSIDDLEYDPAIWETALLQLYTRAGSVWYRTVVDMLEQAKADPGDLEANSGAMRRIFRRVRDAAVGLTEITRRGLIRLVTGSSSEIGVDEALDLFYNSDVFADRIRRIAEEEMLTATSQAGAEAAAAVQRVVVKEWLSRRDDAVRPAHSDADGFYAGSGAVLESEPFTVGGESLQYPRDPSGSAGNIANCRCIATYREVPLSPEGFPLA